MWLGINSQLVSGGDFGLTLSNIILLMIKSFNCINILIWKQMHDFRFYLYLLWKNNLMKNQPIKYHP